MAKKVTPQETHQAFIQTLDTLGPEKHQFFGHVSTDWQSLSDEQRREFEIMTLKMNSIVGEFEVDK